MTTKRIIKPTHYPWDPNFEDRPYSLAVERATASSASLA